MSESKDLKTLFPGTVIKVGGEDIFIKPFTVGQLPLVTKHLAGVIAATKVVGDDIISLFGECGEDLLAIAGVAVQKPRAWFNLIDADEGLELMGTVIALNKEFFEKKVGPVLIKLAAAATGMVKMPETGAGSTQS